MARKCPACGNVNDDSLGFCSECGEPVDPELRLAMELKNASETHHPKQQASHPRREDNDYEPVSDDDDDGRKSPLLWVILAVVVVAAIILVWRFLL